MNAIFTALGGIIGLGLLYYGADFLVRGGSAIAVRSRISPLVIGLTLVAFGTSAPELFVSAGAAYHGLGDICVGNIVGSNICNILLILGVSALIRPLDVNTELFRRDLPIMILVSALLTAVCLILGGIGRFAGLAFVIGIVAYTAIGIRGAPAPSSAPSTGMPRGRAVLYAIGGLVALVVGAKLILAGAVMIERCFGVSDEFVALTMVAVGTSLPELATSIVAARKGEADIAIGNVVGSNIFNILGILGVSALIRPVMIEGMDWVDFIMMIATGILLFPLMRMRGRLGCSEGVLLLAIYGGYLIWLIRTM